MKVPDEVVAVVLGKRHECPSHDDKLNLFSEFVIYIINMPLSSERVKTINSFYKIFYKSRVIKLFSNLVDRVTQELQLYQQNINENHAKYFVFSCIYTI